MNTAYQKPQLTRQRSAMWMRPAMRVTARLSSPFVLFEPRAARRACRDMAVRIEKAFGPKKDVLRLLRRLAKARATRHDRRNIVGELSATVLHLHARTKGLDERSRTEGETVSGIRIRSRSARSSPFPGPTPR